jgi:hypothetical protein
MHQPLGDGRILEHQGIDVTAGSKGIESKAYPEKD